MAKVTKCTECGKSIEYKTNPPKRCTECKNKKAEASRKRRETQITPSKWKKETLLFHTLASIFNKHDSVFNGYYSWLKSPKGEPMQLDWYCPSLQVAFELQGKQHYTYSPYFHKSKNAFKYLQQCDKLKAEACAARHIILITVKYDKVISKNYIIARLKECAPHILGALSLDK